MEPRIPQKSWDPSLEGPLLERWASERIYERRRGEACYTIDTPPPYPSGRPWHVGAAAHYAQIDMIARCERMAGKNVYFALGIDRNGLPVELYTEKKHGIRMAETDRAEFVRLCSESLDDLEDEMARTLAALGVSADIGGRYRTDSAEYRALTQATFIDLWGRGLVYVATRPTNYDWVTGTSVADAEVAHGEAESELVRMDFAVEGGGSLAIASTRPELLCACRAIVVNPDDARHAPLVGRRATVPIFGNSVVVVAHPSASAEFGTGAVMVCSYGDQNDVALFRELGLEEVASIGLDGRMTAAAGPWAGLRPRQARARAIADLEAAGALAGREGITHSVPVSERSGNPIEIVPLEEYYLRQLGSLDDVRKASDGVAFRPEAHRQILHNWLGSVSIDWPISRRRYYGTEIPIWRCESCGEAHVPEPGGYVRPWAEAAPWEACTSCGGRLAGETRTFDTWMDSSISPLFISGYGRDEDLFAAAYPAAVRPQGKDIVRTWLYYTLLRCWQLTGRAPWSEAWVMGYGLDSRGGKMSKSRGNVIDPLPLIGRVGADAFRLWSACEAGHGQDFRCDEERIVATKKSLSKLWNVARLVSSFPDPGEGAGGSTETDRWILGELDALVAACAAAYAEHDFFTPAIATREFVRNVFAAHYVEMAKGRAYGDGFGEGPRDSARRTLHEVLSTVLRLMAPITPFITDHLWRELYSGTSVHLETMPSPRGLGDVSAQTRAISEFNSGVWNEKKRRGLSLRDPVDIAVPGGLAAYAPDLVPMHGLRGP
ncbi:MAG: valine--tRNA ligase [Thaumarchaeota archaeon]|nr:valine--tRNA ligase [Nitrososphaerota archaeon]